MEWNVSEVEQASLESEFNIRLIDTKDIYLSFARTRIQSSIDGMLLCLIQYTLELFIGSV